MKRPINILRNAIPASKQDLRSAAPSAVQPTRRSGKATATRLTMRPALRLSLRTELQSAEEEEPDATRDAGDNPQPSPTESRPAAKPIDSEDAGA